jgi:hypothetical protein
MTDDLINQMVNSVQAFLAIRYCFLQLASFNGKEGLIIIIRNSLAKSDHIKRSLLYLEIYLDLSMFRGFINIQPG